MGGYDIGAAPFFQKRGTGVDRQIFTVCVDYGHQQAKLLDNRSRKVGPTSGPTSLFFETSEVGMRSSSIDPLNPNLLGLDDLSKICPGRPHRITVLRWMLGGKGGHVLESIKVKGIRYSTREALSRFLTATGEEKPKPNGKRARRAKRKLAKAGI